MKKILFYFSLMLLIIVALILVYHTISLPSKHSFSTTYPSITQAAFPTLSSQKSDLSSLLLIASQDSMITLLDPAGNKVGTPSIRQPLRAPDGSTNGLALKELSLKQPISGNYMLTISTTDNTFTATLYVYDVNAQVHKETLNGGSTATYKIVFDKQDVLHDLVQKE